MNTMRLKERNYMGKKESRKENTIGGETNSPHECVVRILIFS